VLDAATLKLEEQQKALATQAKRIDALIGVRADIIQALSTSLNKANMKAAVDPNNGDIVLDSAVFFETGKSTIKAEGQALLDRFVPVYLDVLLRPEYADYLGEIIIEGHTDSSGSYDKNLKLSQDRALQVALYCLNMPGLTGAQKAKLQQILTAKGKSYSDLVYDENGREDPEASRRVEFKFSLKDAEMIEEMNRILEGDTKEEAKTP
jgi:chemotaxis protein MotB